MKQSQTSVKKLARLLETAAKKHNQSADATCSVACCDLSDGDLSNEMLDSVFETVTELAGSSLENKPDYRRAARELIAKLSQRTLRQAPGKSTSRK